jgi:S1-C subfamily serine protease
MRVTDRLRRTGVAAAMTVGTGGTVAACSAAAVHSAVSPPRPAAAVTARGAAIVAVTPGGVAERAGLRAGDVISKLGPAPTPDAAALLSALAAADPGQRVELTITGSGQPHTVPVTLSTLSATRP